MRDSRESAHLNGEGGPSAAAPPCPTLLRPVDGGFVGAVAVEVAGYGLVAGLPEFEDAVGGVDLAVAVGVDDPLAVLEDGDLFDAVAVEIADDGQVAFFAELG